MYRKTFAAVFAAVLAPLAIVATASAAEAAPRTTAARTTLTVVATGVTTHGPSSTPVDEHCMSVKPPGSTCGYAFVTVTVKGFDALGGLSDCDPYATNDPYGECAGTSEEAWNQYGSVDWQQDRARYTEIYTCGTSKRPHVHSTRIGGAGIWYGFDSSAGYASRLDSDTARLRTAFEFPAPSSYSVCPGTTRFVRGYLSDVRVAFDGTNGAPDATWKVGGVHRIVART